MSEEAKGKLDTFFWNDPRMEPKRSFRWLVQFDNLVDHIPPHFIKSVKKPSFTANSKRIQGLGYAVNVAQQIQYNPVEITCIDDQVNTLTNWVYYYFRHTGLEFNGTQGAQTCIDTDRAKNKTRNVEIVMLDADGNGIETWTLYNAWISSFNQSDLTYDTEDLATYTLTLTYDWFEYSEGTRPGFTKKQWKEQDQFGPNPPRTKKVDVEKLEKIHGAHNTKKKEPDVRTSGTVNVNPRARSMIPIDE